MEFVNEKYRIFYCGVGRECEFYELGEFYEFGEFGGRWEGNTNLVNGGKGMRIRRIERILRIFLSLVVVCEFWANGNE